MSKGTILVIGSNATELEAQGGGTIKIGQFLNETAVPLMTLVAAGYDFVLATPTGEKPHMDQDSEALIYFANDGEARRRARDFFNNDPAMNDVRTIRSVIDSGLARLPRYDPFRGINTLLIERISQASAEQRAGRAGRTAPGICVRLWTEREHQERAAREMPEVKRLDLSEVVLALKSAGITDLQRFRWLEAPDARGLADAEELLHDLGALDKAGAITPVGLRGAVLCPNL